jgi:hypothetical protein
MPLLLPRIGPGPAPAGDAQWSLLGSADPPRGRPGRIQMCAGAVGACEVTPASRGSQLAVGASLSPAPAGNPGPQRRLALRSLSAAAVAQRSRGALPAEVHWRSHPPATGQRDSGHGV